MTSLFHFAPMALCTLPSLAMISPTPPHHYDHFAFLLFSRDIREFKILYHDGDSGKNIA